MSIPINILRFNGIWNASTRYYLYDIVESPLDNLCYVNISANQIVGGNDPSTQPSAVWFPYSVVSPTYFTPAYASFSASGTQNLTQNAETILQYDTQDIVPQGIIIKMPGNQALVPSVTGVYKLLASIQFEKTGGGNGEVYMYPKVNGVAVPNSATLLAINQSEETVMTVEWFLNINSANPVEIACYTTEPDIEAIGIPANPPVPVVPSIITTMMRIA